MKHLVYIALMIMGLLWLPAATWAAPLIQYQGAVESPRPNAVLKGQVSIEGTANHPELWKYEIRVVPGLNQNAPDEQWNRVAVVEEQPVSNGQLAIWNTTIVPDGVYTLRLRVVRRDGNWQDFDVLPLNVANTAPPTETLAPPASATLPPPASATLPPPASATLPPPASATLPPPASATLPPPASATLPPPPSPTSPPLPPSLTPLILTATASPTVSPSPSPSPSVTASLSVSPTVSVSLTPLGTPPLTVTVETTPILELTLTAISTVLTPVATAFITPTIAAPVGESPTPLVPATLVPSDGQPTPLTTASPEAATATAIIIDQPTIIVPTSSAAVLAEGEEVAATPTRRGENSESNATDSNLPSLDPLTGLFDVAGFTSACLTGAAFTAAIFLLIGILFFLKSLLRLFL